MTIVDRLTVTQFELVRMCHQIDADGNLVTLADMRLRNAVGNVLGHDSIAVL
jgi:hypothetical protein